LEEFTTNLKERIDTVSGIDILKLAADVHYNFVNIHPFGDGNGRTARLLMNYIQLYHNQPFIKIFTEDRVEYIECLNETEAQQNPDIFREFIASQQIKFLKAEIELFNRSSTDQITLF
jgi:Fic family protein